MKTRSIVLRRPWLAGVLALAVLTGCGSTVQLTGAQAQGAQGEGLSAPFSAPGSTPDLITGSTITNDPSSGVPVTAPVTGATSHDPMAPAGTSDGPTSAVVTGKTSATTGSISIGILAPKEGAADKLGATNGATVSLRSVLEALVRALNAKGGLAGRRIVPVFADFDSAGSDFNQQLEAACATFTQDHKVTVVLSALSIFSPSFEKCLARTSTPHVDGSYAVGDSTALKQYPLMVGPAAVATDRRMRAMVETAWSDGWLTAKSKVGVVLDECDYNTRAYNGALMLSLKAHGLAIASTSTLSCTTGFASAGSAAAALANAVLAFRSAGVDRVLIDSDYEAVFTLLFAKNADSQGYTPGYLMSSMALPAAQTLNLPKSQLVGMHGIGWLPGFDSATAPFSAGGKRCFTLLAGQGIQLKSQTDRATASSDCEAFFLYESALRLTHGDSSATAVLDVLGSATRTYAYPSQLAGSTLSTSRHDGATVGRPFAYESACSCFRYHGQNRNL